jgi:hypothetical protein
VTGDGIKDGENFLKLNTQQTFSLISIYRNDLKALDIAMLDDGTHEEACKGCPRSGGMACWDEGACSICWCPFKKKP